MYISKMVVERNGGNISYMRELGKGTVFVVALETIEQDQTVTWRFIGCGYWGLCVIDTQIADAKSDLELSRYRPQSPVCNCAILFRINGTKIQLVDNLEAKEYLHYK